MPQDYRRIQGPEVSEDYRKLGPTEQPLIKNKGDRTRGDGRKCKDLRKIFLKTGVVTQAKGSAYIELDHTKVICSVFDPREKPRSSEHNLRGEIFCEFKFASFSGLQRRSHQQEADDKEYSLLLKNALEPAVCLHEFPNFQVEVHVLVLQDDGSSLAAAITCAGLALGDAAVPMYDLPVGLSKAFLGDTELTDPTGVEERVCLQGVDGEDEHGMFTVSLLPTFNQVSQLYHTGHITPSRFQQLITETVELGAEVHKAVQATLLSAVKGYFFQNDLM
ncbi:exosome complex component MTR3-like isoform X2 [Neocloeon triangulifer]|uniref:exosome complex component MTR3-like isoform X2 n=1 Tax=Neocloeon triangulifer TaxID=2078957 RepID=UPI00286F7293|nr:exosome complex component MTR3-like isoform X2 [Neocloeon triangulifer]